MLRVAWLSVSCCVILFVLYMSWTEILYIFIVLSLIIYGVCVIVRSGAAAGRKCTININARHASGFGRLAILESVYAPTDRAHLF